MKTTTSPKQKGSSRGRKMQPRVTPPTDRELAIFDEQETDLLLRAMHEPVEYFDHPAFRSRNIEKTLFGQDPQSFAQDNHEFVATPAYIPDADPDSIARVRVTTPTRDQEQVLFQRYNFARREVFRIIKAHTNKRLSRQVMRDLVKWLKIANASRAHIVQANMPLVLAMAKRSRITGVDFADLISEGNMALLRSVEKFDCSRGFKFSTYGCRAILKAFSRVAQRAMRYRSRFPTEFDPALEKSDFLERQRELVEEDHLDGLRDVLAGNYADLTDVERRVIQARFALQALDPEDARPLTLAQVGEIVGVTKERVRQIQNKALEKLRHALEDNIAAA